MDVSTWLSVGSLLVAAVSAFGAIRAVRNTRKLQENQWSRDELELRRNVLRRLLAYRYRLTAGRVGTEGEPFVALNEAWVVFSRFPEVTGALTKMHDELGVEGRLRPNIIALVRVMAAAAEIPVQNLDDDFIERPFTPRETPDYSQGPVPEPKRNEL